MNLATYKEYLGRHGRNLAEVKKNQSDVIIDRTFKRDPNYKRVYILTRDGWKFEDAKYQIHSTLSIVRDAVDQYLQFRPKVHYPIGSYVIVPNDTDFDINLTEEQLLNPWSQPPEDRTQWWIIVGRDDARSFVRYNILKCNYELRWLWKGQIYTSFGCFRNANSYTSGVWRDEIGKYLDNIDSMWLPDVANVYGVENLSKLNLFNNQLITYDQRFMLTHNYIDPKIYQVTKVTDMAPSGIIKLTLKQDEFNEKRDSIEMRICDYFTDEGNLKVDVTPSKEVVVGNISCLIVNDNGELEPGPDDNRLMRGKISYFKVDFESVDPEWKITLIDDSELSDDDVDYYTGLISVTEFSDLVVAIKPAKAGSLVGKKFRLSATDINGIHYSSIDLEVV